MENLNQAPSHSGSKHICALFRDTAKQVELVGDFLAAGLQKGEKGAVAVAHGLQAQISQLLDRKVDNLPERIAQKELEFIDPESFYLSGGRFSIEEVLGKLDSVYQNALSAGFKGVRGIGEMSWALKAWDVWENLFTYETRVSEYIKHKNFSCICMYDPALFPAKHLYRAMLTHPHLATENYSGPSPTYVPADQFLLEQWKNKFDSAALNKTGKQFIVVEQKVSQTITEEKPLTDKLLDHIADSVLLVDAQGIIRYMNQAAQNRYGNQVNRTCHDSIFKETRPCPVCQLIKLVGEGKDKVETEIQDGKGARLNVSAYAYSNGTLSNSLIVFLRDVTQKRRWEEEMAFLDKFTSLGYLSSGIAHELNNNLTPILICAQMLNQANVPEPVQQKAQKIENSATECKRLVDSLTDFAQKIPHRKDFVNLNQTLQKTVDLMEYRLSSANIKLELRLDQSLPYLLVDEIKIQQVFSNIITNAYQAMHNSGGKIIISSSCGESWCRFEIADTGPGIPAEIQSKIFDPFFTTRQIGEGKGLGLSTSFGIVTAHQGKISFVTQENAGTTFVVELPLNPVGSSEVLQKEAPQFSPAPSFGT